MLVLSSQAFAQSDDPDSEMRIQRLENQLRQLTGQNEELQYRNRQLEDRLRQLGASPAAPGGPPQAAQPQAALPAVQPNPAYRQPGYPQARLAAVSCRLRTKRRLAHPVDVAPASRSISVPPARAIPVRRRRAAPPVLR